MYTRTYIYIYNIYDTDVCDVNVQFSAWERTFGEVVESVANAVFCRFRLKSLTWQRHAGIAFSEILHASALVGGLLWSEQFPKNPKLSEPTNH